LSHRDIPHTPSYTVSRISAPHIRKAEFPVLFRFVYALKEAVTLLQKAFKFRTCHLEIREADDKRRFFRPCLLYPIKQCTAPCAAKISKELYREDINRLIRFLDGDKKRVLAGLEREAERLVSESDIAKQELETLGLQRGQVALSFESVTERLKRLEAEIAELRLQIEASRAEESQSKRRGDQLRGEVATLNGRRNSLEGLIKEHSYSTDTVRNIFKTDTYKQNTNGMAAVGTLADFLEVDGKYESVVDEFLRDELNYIVVKSWDAADAGMHLLQTDVSGRATFLVHPNDAQANFAFAEGMQSAAQTNIEGIEGVVPLKECVRVLDGFGRSLEVILPKLREGFVAPDSYTARSLALSNPQAFFLSPSGETFHNVTVTGGRPRAQGPLALKRELVEVQQKVEKAEQELAQTDLHTADLQHQIGALNAAIEGKTHERRDAERESANSGAALRQMESEVARIERRLQDWALTSERNRDARNQKADLIARRQQEAAAFENERITLETNPATPPVCPTSLRP